MAIKKKKISELTLSESLVGLTTIGVDASNRSVRVELEFVKTAADSAISAAESANNATSAASMATNSATTAASNANTAKDAANAAATLANTKATEADEKAKQANDAATAANTAKVEADRAAVNATNATSAATLAANSANAGADRVNASINEATQATSAANNAAVNADTKASAANNAAVLAGEKADLADQKATQANTSATAADTAATAANMAKVEADRAAVNATNATSAATLAANSANAAADRVDTSIIQATQAAGAANSAASNADTKASAANNAAILAGEKADLADQKATQANTSTTAADSAATAANTAAGRVDTAITNAAAATLQATNAATNADVKALAANNAAGLAAEKATLAGQSADAAHSATTAASAAKDAADRSATEAASKATLAGEAATSATAAAAEARQAAGNINSAINKATEVAENPTKVGPDNYVYAYDLATKTYIKTDIYVKGEPGKDGSSDFHVDEVRMSYSLSGNIFGDKYLPCDGRVVEALSYPDSHLPGEKYKTTLTSGSPIIKLKYLINGKFAALCSNVVFLSDKANGPWVGHPVPSGDSFYDITVGETYGGWVYFIAAGGGRIYASADLQSYTTTETRSPANVNLVEYYNGKMFAITSSGSLYSAPFDDPFNWKWTNSSFNSFIDIVGGKEGVLVGISQFGTVVYSKNDGRNWDSGVPTVMDGQALVSIIYDETAFFAVSTTGKVFKSPTGEVRRWELFADLSGVKPTKMYYQSRLYILVQGASMYTSKDALSWTKETPGSGSVNIGSVAMTEPDTLISKGNIILINYSTLKLPTIANGYIKLLK